MSELTTLPIKDPQERIPLGFDFSGDLTSGDALASAVVTVDAVVLGTDPAPTVLDGGPSISGALVLHWIKEGVVGATYRLMCKATTTGGAIYVKRGLLPVAQVLA